jgi:hypothetical protein
VAWIPTVFAVENKELLIHDTRLIVEKVGLTEKAAPIYTEELIRAHRKNTGDSLPKGD